MQGEKKIFSTENMIKMALMSVIAVVLMQYGAIKLPALFPSFLEIDFSEVPAIVGMLTIHPLAGIVIVIFKNVLKALVFGTSSVYIGEIANLVVSLGYILPLTLLVKKRRDIRTVSIGIILGILGIMVAGGFINYFVTIPMYAKLYMPMETIIQMGNSINPAITSKITCCFINTVDNIINALRTIFIIL